MSSGSDYRRTAGLLLGGMADFLVAFLPVWIGVLAAGVAGATVTRHAPRDFFEVGAQIIVVLLLAAALESRLLGARRVIQTGLFPDSLERSIGPRIVRLQMFNILVMILFTAVALVLGEINALNVLASSARSANPATLFAAIVFGMVSLTLTALLAPASRARSDG